MRRSKTTYLGLFCLACFIVYLRLSSRRRRRRIAALEQALWPELEPTPVRGIGTGTWTTHLDEMQGAVQSVFATGKNYQQVLPASPTIAYGSFVAEDSWQNYLAVERRIRNPPKKRRRKRRGGDGGMNREVYCGECGRKWPDVIETRPGVTYCECGAILVEVKAVPRATLEAIWGPGHIPSLDAVRKPR